MQKIHKRKLRLPNEDELSKEQKDILRLGASGRYLIIGGPGTGKSVVAALRAIKYSHLFLAYNKTLIAYMQQTLKQYDKEDIECKTLDSFFFAEYKRIFGQNAPTIKEYIPDYDKISEQILAKDDIKLKYSHLIIDEGQDKPVKYYQALIDYGYENFFIVADQNQQITEQNSNRQELSTLLALDAKDVYELKKNYRNSASIARLCEYFYTDTASPKIDIPADGLYETLPLLYTCDEITICKKILKFRQANPSYLIAVVTATNEIQERLYKELNTNAQNLGCKTLISKYNSDAKQYEIDFSKAGIVILNDRSIKGLEFEAVFIINDGFKKTSNNPDLLKKRLYVMASRAMKNLVFVKCGTSNIQELLPKDPNLLRIM